MARQQLKRLKNAKVYEKVEAKLVYVLAFHKVINLPQRLRISGLSIHQRFIAIKMKHLHRGKRVE